MRKSVKWGAVAAGTAACIALGTTGAWANETPTPNSTPADTGVHTDFITTRTGTVNYYVNSFYPYGAVLINGALWQFTKGQFTHGSDSTFWAGEIVTATLETGNWNGYRITGLVRYIQG